MSRKQLAVCLLALAGIEVSLLAAHARTFVPRHSQDTAAVRYHAQDRFGYTHSLSSTAVPPPKSGSNPASFTAAPKSGSRDAVFSLPMTFEPNIGQADSRAQFIGRGTGMTVFLTRDEIAVRANSHDTLGIRFEAARGRNADHRQLRIAASGISWHGEQQLRGQSNYLIGSDPREWRTGVEHFASVEAGRAMPGVNARVYGGERGVEYDLEFAPGVDPTNLRVALEGAQDVRLRANGDLQMRVGNEEVKMKKPRAYQKPRASKHSHRRKRRRPLRASPRKPRRPRKQGRNHATRKAVDASYVLEADGTIGLRVGPYDPSSVLVIDPVLSIAYASFLGGSGTDVAASVAVDSSGKIYVGGTTTSSTSFPEGLGHRQGPVDGPSEFFIAKIDPTVSGANSLIYLTFLGGSGKQVGGQIAVDGAGDVAITGTTTSVDFPLTDTSAPTNGLTSGYGNDVIVSEIDPTGTRLVFSTLFGGSGAESLNGPGGVAVDSSGDVFIASDTSTTPVDTNTPDLPVSDSAFQNVWDGEPSDGFLAIFAPPAQAGGAATLKYCSYLGTNAAGTPGVGGIAVDSSHNAYIAGFAANTVSGFPSKGALQSQYGGGTADAFLMKISPLGAGSQDLVYATELGGSDEDEALGVAVDSANPPNAYVTGVTQSPDFPMGSAPKGFQTAMHANATSSAFLAVVSENPSTGQTSLAYSTYLGGSSADTAQGIAVSAPNAVYITGIATSFDFPWRDNLQPFNGAGDAFVAKLDPTSAGTASLIYSTPLGGTSPPGGTAGASGNAVAADGAGHVYVAGITTSGDFPTALTTNGGINGFQQNCSSCTSVSPASDAFVAEISEAAGQSPSVLFTLPHVSFPAGVGSPQFVGVLNSGETGLTISNISVTGPNAADFPISGQAACIGQTISPGLTAQCSFEVGFAPTSLGPETAAVTVTDNAPGSPQVLELKGAGGTGPLAAVSPASVNFGSLPENTASATPTVVYLQNIGSQPLTLSSFTLGGANATQFELNAGGSNGFAACQRQGSVAPGGSCVVQLSFAPTSEGSFQAELDFFDNSGNVANPEQIVPLTGIGLATAPIAKVTPPMLPFGSVTTGATSAAQSVTLTNNGSAALNVPGIALTGSNATEFAITSTGTTCPLTGGSVAIGANCTVAVQFTPQTVGSKNASLSFTDNAAGSPQQVSLSGTAAAAVTVAVSPANLVFSAQSEGTSSAAQAVSVSNTGATPAGVGPVSVSGINASEFAAVNSCAPSLAAGKSCQISVTFNPANGSTPGSRFATLNVGGGSPSTVALSGAATEASISVPPSVGFGSQLAGTAGAPVPVVVTNNSSGSFAGALVVLSVSVNESGGTSGDFSITADSCTGPATAPGGTCTVNVAFQPASLCPTVTGTRNATLTINDNAPGSPHTVALSGTAVDFCVGTAQGQGVSEPISAGGSETFNLEIQSSDPTSGSAQLACSVPPQMLGGCTISTTPASNPPVVQISLNSPGMFQMVVTSTAPGAVAIGAGRIRGAPPPEVAGQSWRPAAAMLGSLAIWVFAQFPSSRTKRSPSSAAMAQIGVVVFALAVGLAACGGGGGTAPATDPAPGSPPGTYAVIATAKITVGQAAVTRTFTESVTIQPQ
jgi:Cep192 domain 4